MATSNKPNVEGGATPTGNTSDFKGRMRDLIFVLDSSGSIAQEDFERALLFIRRVINLIDISENDTRVALVNYGSTVKAEFSLHHYSKEEDIQKAIMKVSQLGGSTKTSLALEKAHQIIERRHNTKNPLIIVLVTDGHSDNTAQAVKISTALKQQWLAHIFAVGVGNTINRGELGELASSKENVLLVDSYKALKTVRAKIVTKICLAVPRPRFNKDITAISPVIKVVFISASSNPDEDDTEHMIQHLRQLDKEAQRINLVHLTFEEDATIHPEKKEWARQNKVTLVGSMFPNGCRDAATSDIDIYTNAFYQHILYSSVLSNTTYIICNHPSTKYAGSNIANALENKDGTKPKKMSICNSEYLKNNMTEIYQLSDIVLYTEDSELTRKSRFHLQDASKRTASDKVTQDASSKEKDCTPDNLQNMLTKPMLDGLQLQIRLTVDKNAVDDACTSQGSKLRKVVNLLRSIIETRAASNTEGTDSLSKAENVSSEVIEKWSMYLKEVEESDRKVIRVEQTDNLAITFTTFCATEDSVRNLWEKSREDKPATASLHKALEASEIQYDMCEITIKSGINHDLIGSVVTTSDSYVKRIAGIIKTRKAEQDRTWSTTYGSKRDRQIANEIQNERLEKRWASILEEARNLMGERGVEALQKAREQYDDDPEFITQIEIKMETGNFLDFLKDTAANLCCIQ